jgi:carboxymethylenebutenolidase
MGEIVEFPSNGTPGQGYLAAPSGDQSGHGILVIHEWWGLVPHIKDVCDRYAAEGFVALAPDLYHGETTTEPEQAAKLMATLDLPRAGRDMSGALDVLAQRAEGSSLGATGFGMGGGLALLAGTQRPDRIKAVVPYYAVLPRAGLAPEWSLLGGPVQAHATGLHGADESGAIAAAGKEVDVFEYPGASAGFFNDTLTEGYRPDDARQAWDRTITFFRERLRS